VRTQALPGRRTRVGEIDRTSEPGPAGRRAAHPRSEAGRAHLRRERDLRILKLAGGLEPPTCCLQDSSGPSTAYQRVPSWQLTSGGLSSQYAPDRPSTARWNDKRNDIADSARRSSRSPVRVCGGWRAGGPGRPAPPPRRRRRRETRGRTAAGSRAPDRSPRPRPVAVLAVFDDTLTGAYGDCVYGSRRARHGRIPAGAMATTGLPEGLPASPRVAPVSGAAGRLVGHLWYPTAPRPEQDQPRDQTLPGPLRRPPARDQPAL
jgi:hypothetical protein